MAIVTRLEQQQALTQPLHLCQQPPFSAAIVFSISEHAVSSRILLTWGRLDSARPPALNGMNENPSLQEKPNPVTEQCDTSFGATLEIRGSPNLLDLSSLD